MTDLGCLGIIQSRFRLFRHDSRPISACFGHWPIRLDSANIALFWSNLLSSARIKPSCCKSKKKKNAYTQHQRAGNHVGRRTPRQAVSNFGAAPSQLRSCFVGFGCHVLSSLFWFQGKGNSPLNVFFFFFFNFTKFSYFILIPKFIYIKKSKRHCFSTLNGSS